MAKNEVKVTIAGENKADAALRQVTAQVKELSSQYSTMRRVVGGVGVGLVVRELAQMAKHALDSAEAMGKLSQKTGASTEFMSGMAHAVNMADIGVGDLENGMKFLSRRMAEAAAGSDSAQALFRRLGVSVTDANGKLRPMQQVMLEIADRFANMKDGAGKSATALELFSRSGTNLIPMLNAGSEGLKAWFDQARALGIEISGNTARRAEDLNDAVKLLKAQVEGLTLQFLEGLVPALSSTAAVFTETDDRFKSGATTFGEILGETLKQTVALFYDLVFAIHTAMIAWDKWLSRPKDLAEAVATVARGGIPVPTGAALEDFGAQMAEMLKLRDKFLDVLFGSPGARPTTPPRRRGTDDVDFGAGQGVVVGAPTKGTWDVSDLQDLRSMADIFKEMEQTTLGPRLAGAREQIGKLLNLPGPVPRGWPDQLAQLEMQIALTFGKLQIETDKVRAQVERGEIDQITGQQKIIELHRATGDELAALLPEYERLAALTGDPALAQGVEALRAETERLRKEVDALGRIAREVFEDNFADALTNLITGTESVADAFRNMARAILTELTRIIAKMLIVWAIQQLLGFVTGGLGGGRGVGFENAISTTPTTFNNPFPGRALGGGFAAGQTMWVGERGPELVRFRHGGTVIPNDRLQTSAGRGGGLTIQVHAQVDARGSELSAAEVEARVARGVEVSVMAALQANRESQLRGGR